MLVNMQKPQCTAFGNQVMQHSPETVLKVSAFIGLYGPTEGRVEPTDGTLMCSYHGWRFDGEGRCTAIPQADDEKSEATACASSRSAVATYPTQVDAPASAC